jgi:hypothetical protein
VAKITRHEFMGSKVLLFFLFLFGITIPFALVYLIGATISIEEEIGDANEFLEAFRTGKIGRR